MGENRWRDEDDWPLARARPTPWYLRAGGGLSEEPPGDEEPDRYVYDPNDPAPTIGGPTSLPPRLMKANAGPLDQSKLEDRPDVLVYTSPPLERPLEVTGPLTATIHAATDATDTDFVVKLAEVWPDGRSLILGRGHPPRPLPGRLRPDAARRAGRGARIHDRPRRDLERLRCRQPDPGARHEQLVPALRPQPELGQRLRHRRPPPTCDPHARPSSTTADGPRTSSCPSCLVRRHEILAGRIAKGRRRLT